MLLETCITLCLVTQNPLYVTGSRCSSIWSLVDDVMSSVFGVMERVLGILEKVDKKLAFSGECLK